MIKLIAIGFLMKYIGGGVIEFKLDAPKKLKDIINIPSEIQNRIIILINNVAGTLDSIVNDNDTVALMPIIGGG
ncbi:MAG: MoaD/ThiS family protein [Candidatus Methanomethylicia archaeon]